VLGVASVGMYEAERGASDGNITTLGDALWWAITTVTTVGYGDRYPTTALGRMIAVGLMLVGIALLGVVTATIAAWFVGRLREVEETSEQADATMQDVLAELREVRSRLDTLTAREG
jgi:voltage-gated potassium channel